MDVTKKIKKNNFNEVTKKNVIKNESILQEKDDNKTKILEESSKYFFEVIKNNKKLIKDNKIKNIFLFITILFIGLILYPNKNTFIKKISFSIPIEEKKNDLISKKYYIQAIEILNKGKTVQDLYKAQEKLHISLRSNSLDDESKGLYIKIWSKLLPHIENKSSYKQFFDYLYSSNMIRSKRFVYGFARFYLYFQKYEAAVKILEESSLLNTNQDDLEGLLIEAYTLSGNLDKAKELIDKKENSDHYDILKSKTIYYQYIKDNTSLEKNINRALTLYKNDFFFMMAKVDFYLESKNILYFSRTLIDIDKNGFEGSLYYYALYLKNKSIDEFLHGNEKEGLKSMKKSLSILPDDLLYKKLSYIDFKKSKELYDLFLNSKKKNIYLQIEDLIQKKDFYLATTIISENSNDLRIDLLEVLLFVEQGFFNIAYSKIDTLMKKNTNKIEVYEMYLYVLFESKRYNFLLKTINESKEKFISDKVMYYQAISLFHIGNYKKSLNLFSSLMNKDFFNEKYLEYFIKIFFIKKKYEDCKKYTSKLIKMNPFNLNSYLVYSDIIYEVDGVKEAIGYLLSLPDIIKNKTIIMSKLSTFYYKIGDNQSYLFYKKDLEIFDQKDEFLENFLLERALLDEKYDEALIYIDSILKSFPKKIDLYLLKSKIFFLQFKFEESLYFLNVLEEKFSLFPEIYLLRAKIYFKQNKYNEALIEIEKEEKFNFVQVETLYLKGAIFLKQNNIDSAENFFKKSLEINPNYIESLIGIADISEQKKNYPWALNIYNKILTLDPSLVEIYKNRGGLYSLMGNRSMAIDDYRIYIEMNGADKESIQKILSQIE